jgi:DNA-binding LacI/PurR family transcriptional regulator
VAAHPNVVFLESPGVPGTSCVTIDREEAARLAVGHLLARGRKRIGLAVMTDTRPACRARRRGYEAELAAHGLAPDERLLFVGESQGIRYAAHNRITRKWEFPVERMDRLIEALVDGQQADAIVTPDDYWAAALIRRMRQRGIRVPDQVAVVGYLNHYLADWIDPPLTTVDPRHRVAARVMVRLLESMIQGNAGQPAEVKIRPRLIVREST